MAFVGSAAFLVAPPAMAQTPGYPPTCNLADVPQNGGTHQVGETFFIVVPPSCSFTAGATVNVTVNGVSIGTKVAESGGIVSVQITVVSATQLSIDDPILVAARCGTNTVVGTGPSDVAGRNVTQTVNFTVNCPGTPGTNPATSVRGSVAFTGANIAKWAAIALALVGMGAVLLTLNRRRGHAEG